MARTSFALKIFCVIALSAAVLTQATTNDKKTAKPTTATTKVASGTTSGTTKAAATTTGTSATSATETKECSSDCANCGADAKCLVCMNNTKPNTSGTCAKADPAVDNCKTYTTDGCSACDRGYALLNKDNKLTCVKITIDDCVVGTVTSSGTGTDAKNTFKCTGCKGKQLKADTTSCVALTDTVKKENCMIYSATACMACNDEYALGTDGKCVKNDKGCLLISSSKCTTCNIYDGFYASSMNTTAGQVCKKSAFLRMVAGSIAMLMVAALF